MRHHCSWWETCWRKLWLHRDARLPVSLAETEARARAWLERMGYTVLLARWEECAAGFIATAECRTLYAEGRFGIIRSYNVSRTGGLKAWGRVGERAKRVARSNSWARLGVHHASVAAVRPLAFYERQGSAVSGGRKMKVSL